MDKLVIDIETKNTFADVGGQHNLKKLEASLVGIYSYNQDRYFGFTEDELDKAAELMQKAGLIIGFSINRFDIPVLEKYCPFNIYALKRLDLLEEIEMSFGKRVSLDVLSKANLGASKTYHSLEAIRLYKEGNIEELKNYCLNDVKLTKELYELAKNQGHLVIPDKITGALQKVNLAWQEEILPASLF